MRVLIVDDEPLARERLVRMVGDIDGFEPVGEAANGQQAVTLTHQLQPDVVLMDVEMPGMDGLEAAHHLSTLKAPPVVIFTTAYSEHALAAFEARVIGYLLKPVRAEKLVATLQHAIQRQRLPSDSPPALTAQRTHLCTAFGNSVSLIPLNEVLFFRAEHKYVTLVHKHGESLLEEPLKLLEQEFAGQFIRIHRNALVSLAYIKGTERTPDGKSRLIIDGCDTRLEISRRHLPELRKILKGRLTHQ